MSNFNRRGFGNAGQQPMAFLTDGPGGLAQYSMMPPRPSTPNPGEYMGQQPPRMSVPNPGEQMGGYPMMSRPNPGEQSMNPWAPSYFGGLGRLAELADMMEMRRSTRRGGQIYGR